MEQTSQQGRTAGRLQVVNAGIWAATVLGAAVVVDASEEFLYLLLVLVLGSTASWAAIWGLLVRAETASPGPRGRRSLR